MKQQRFVIDVKIRDEDMSQELLSEANVRRQILDFIDGLGFGPDHVKIEVRKDEEWTAPDSYF